MENIKYKLLMKFCAVLFLLFSAFFQYESKSFQSIESSTISNNNDSLTVLKFTANDSTITGTKDSVILSTPLRNHGSMNLLLNDSFRTINKEEKAYNEYNGFSEMIEPFVPAYPQFLGSPGMFNGYSFFGGLSNSIGVSFNGRPMIDPEYSSINLEQLCPEFMENTEIIVGSDAVIQSDNSSGALINIQEIKYNTKVPFTRLWYTQGGYNFLSADGIYSQNFAPNMNFTFGFRHAGSTGKYKGSELDIWNIRALLRWNPSDYTSISIVEYFTNHKSGINGGIDKELSVETDNNGNSSYNFMDPNVAQPYYTGLEQRVYRHDLSINATSYLAKDSSSAIAGNIYFTNSEWHLSVPEGMYSEVSSSISKYRHNSSYWGADIRIEQELFDRILMKAGAEFFHSNLQRELLQPTFESTSLAFYGIGKIKISDFLSISGGLRLRNYADRTSLSEGVKAIFDLNDYGKLTSDISLSERIPSPTEGLNLLNEKTFLFLNEYRFSVSDYQFNIGAFFRKITDPIIFIFAEKYYAVNSQEISIMGGYVAGSFNIKETVFINASINFHNEFDKTEKILPPVYAKLSAYYEIHAGASIMRLGMSGKIISSYTGQRYLPQYRSFTANDFESGIMTDGLKAFVSAKLGNAYIQASYENILSMFTSGYYYNVPLYPYYDNNFRFTFTWSFLD